MKRLAHCLAVAFVMLHLASLAHGQEKTEVPDDVIKELKYLAGLWEYTGRFGDQKISGTLTARWAKGRHCLITQDTLVEGDQTEAVLGAGVIGWDSIRKRITHGGFSSDNNLFLNWWKVTPAGDWEGEISQSDEGKEETAPFKITKQGRGKFLFESTMADGNELEMVYSRIPRKQKSGKKNN